ncbi:MAG TPA: RNA polymerase sigma factor [Chitinophagaceae bacterium]|jgi:RNA polymerase sigma-70 factor (ECF subfamily)|nr:RNA polymerase sigma factor [Chitinophagaceae bacterium]
MNTETKNEINTLGFNELLLDNADFLKPFAVNLTKDTEAANDLYQETLYKALVNKEKYNSGTNIRAWLYTIMRNIFINNYRRNARQKTIFNNTPEDFLINLRQVSVPNQAEANIRIKEIRAAIEHLPEIFRSPFLLYFDGYKYQEIAEILHEPLGTIKSRIHFARKLLKEQIARG